MACFSRIFFGIALLTTILVSCPEIRAEEPSLGISVVKINNKSDWTEVMIAIENKGEKDAEFQCCKVFLENTDNYAVASLTNAEVRSQIYNKAKTGAIIGTIVGGGLGLGGAISGKPELGYAGVGVAGASTAAGVAGGASAEKNQRSLVIDDIMRNQTFPAGLKVAGIVYFPPKKKWPGSQKAKAIHLTYNKKGESYRISASVP